MIRKNANEPIPSGLPQIPPSEWMQGAKLVGPADPSGSVSRLSTPFLACLDQSTAVLGIIRLITDPKGLGFGCEKETHAAVVSIALYFYSDYEYSGNTARTFLWVGLPDRLHQV